MPAGVFSEVTPEMGNRVLFNAPPSPPRIVSAANSPPSHQIPIPSPERRHRRTFEILEDDLKTKLSFPSFRTAKQCGATHSLGRRTCANCGIVYGSFGGFVVEDDFCRCVPAHVAIFLKFVGTGFAKGINPGNAIH